MMQFNNSLAVGGGTPPGESSTSADAIADVKYSTRKPLTVPNIPGFRCLSLSEIKSDLREMQKKVNLPGNPSDSDSVNSEDVIDSVYPVKPRRSLAPPAKIDGRGRKSNKSVLFAANAIGGDRNNSSSSNSGSNNDSYYSSYEDAKVGNGADVDEALLFMRELKKSNPRLYNREVEREELETRCQAYELSLENEKEVFQASKVVYENYVRLWQGLFARSLQQHSNYSRHNALMCRIYRGLKEQREAADFLRSELSAAQAKFEATKAAADKSKTTAVTAAAAAAVGGKAAKDSNRRSASRRLKTTADNDSSSNSSNNISCDDKLSIVSATAIAVDSTPMLRVHLFDRGDAEVVLHVQQQLCTPLGTGVVVAIRPQQQMVQIQLPFATLFAHIGRVVCWGSCPAEAAAAHVKKKAAAAVAVGNGKRKRGSDSNINSNISSNNNNISRSGYSNSKNNSSNNGSSGSGDSGACSMKYQFPYALGSLPFHSVSSLHHYCESHLKQLLTLPAQELAAIRSCLRAARHNNSSNSSNNSSDDDEDDDAASDNAAGAVGSIAATDNDDGSKEDSESAEQPQQQSNDTAIVAAATANKAQDSLTDNRMDVTTSTESFSTSESLPANIAATSAASTLAKKAPTKSAAITSSSSYSSSSSSQEISVFPLVAPACTKAPRKVVKLALETAVADDFADTLQRLVPCAFAPVDSLPALVKELFPTMLLPSAASANSHPCSSSGNNSSSSHCNISSGIHHSSNGSSRFSNNHNNNKSSSNNNKKYTCTIMEGICDLHLNALSDFYGSDCAAPVGSSGSLAFDGDITEMRAQLRNVGAQIAQLEREQQPLIEKIEYMRFDSARKTAAAAALRLAMFTRRIAHRNHMADHGVHLPITALAASSHNSNNFGRARHFAAASSAVSAVAAAATAIPTAAASMTDDMESALTTANDKDCADAVDPVASTSVASSTTDGRSKRFKANKEPNGASSSSSSRGIAETLRTASRRNHNNNSSNNSAVVSKASRNGAGSGRGSPESSSTKASSPSNTDRQSEVSTTAAGQRKRSRDALNSSSSAATAAADGRTSSRRQMTATSNGSGGSSNSNGKITKGDSQATSSSQEADEEGDEDNNKDEEREDEAIEEGDSDSNQEGVDGEGEGDKSSNSSSNNNSANAIGGKSSKTAADKSSSSNSRKRTVKRRRY